METTFPLRDHLLKSLSTLPGSCRLSVHLLVTTPHKYLGLYPHSSLPLKSRPTVYQQNILALVSVSSPSDHSDAVFISAIEAALYVTPQSHSSILYISKVDSTGQHTPLISSPTRCFVTSFLDFFASPTSRPTPYLRIQLFARAQSQYLFPNSSQFSGKRVLSDVKLCKWWKDVFSQVAAKTRNEWANSPPRLFYLLPGFTKDEAGNMLRSVSEQDDWEYGHPYRLPAIRMYTAVTSPEHDASFPPHDLFDIIPTFSDDPKARFLVELVATNKVDNKSVRDEVPKSPPKKKVKMEQAIVGENRSGQNEEEADMGSLGNDKERSRQLISISMDEFWERMGFRQECSQGAVTGFFVVDFQPVIPIEAESATFSASGIRKSHSSQVSPTLHARILASLLNLDFGAMERAREATKLLLESIQGLVYGVQAADNEVIDREVSNEKSGDQENPGTVSNAATGDEQADFITSSIIVDNGPPPVTGTSSIPGSTAPAATQNPVNVLQPRKKKRPPP
ncbi:hypothetical protein FRC03_005687 [Tulasnella sp. 419]|nr:hypothetical protein FRC03_005687 [Tulasnella sp. 419]